MEATTTDLQHSNSEIGNAYACQRMIKAWINNPEIPSSQIIPSIHKELNRGIDSYSMKGLMPLPPGSYRTTDVGTEGKPENFYVRGFDVSPTMQRYTDELDNVLRKEPESPASKLEETVHDAAWAYFVFEKIHPYLDGNGRVGRMILKRVMKARGYKDIIFSTNAAYGKGRAAHLDAMSAVSSSGNLAHLELYLLAQLQARYVAEGDSGMSEQISGLMEKSRGEISSQGQRNDFTAVWEGFKGLELDGVKELAYSDGNS